MEVSKHDWKLQQSVHVSGLPQIQLARSRKSLCLLTFRYPRSSNRGGDSASVVLEPRTQSSPRNCNAWLKSRYATKARTLVEENTPMELIRWYFAVLPGLLLACGGGLGSSVVGLVILSLSRCICPRLFIGYMVWIDGSGVFIVGACASWASLRPVVWLAGRPFWLWDETHFACAPPGLRLLWCWSCPCDGPVVCFHSAFVAAPQFLYGRLSVPL